MRSVIQIFAVRTLYQQMIANMMQMNITMCIWYIKFYTFLTNICVVLFFAFVHQEELNNFLQSEEVEPATVVLLKAELKKRGLSTVGNKPILKKRLLDVIENNVTVCADIDTQLHSNPQYGIPQLYIGWSLLQTRIHYQTQHKKDLMHQQINWSEMKMKCMNLMRSLNGLCFVRSIFSADWPSMVGVIGQMGSKRLHILGRQDEKEDQSYYGCAIKSWPLTLSH